MEGPSCKPEPCGEEPSGAGLGQHDEVHQGLGTETMYFESLDDLQAFFDDIAGQIAEGDDGSECEDDAQEQIIDIVRPVELPNSVGNFDVDEFVTGRFIYHHVLKNSASIRLRLLKYCCGAFRDGNDRAGFIAALHDNHIHVVHGCSATKGYCRCKDNWGCQPRFSRKHEPSSVGRTGIARIWNYLVSGPGRRLIFWSYGSGQRPAYCSNRVVLPSFKWPHCEKKSLENECKSIGLPDAYSDDSDAGGELSKSSVSFATKCNEIWEMAQEEWIADPETILGIQKVIDKHQNFIEVARDAIIKRLTNKRKTNFDKIKNWTFEDFREFLVNKNPSFGFNRHRIQARAHTFSVLVHWFETQFNEQWPIFFLEFVRIFDGNNGKLNSLVLVGPASCGKTWLVNMFKAIALNFGVVRNWASGDRFCFDNAVNRRLLIHDECSFPINAPDYLEAYKQLAAGQSPTVNVKHKDGTTLPPAPIFITANQHPLELCASQKQFFDNVRWKIYFIHPVPDFAALTEGKNGNPLALFDLYDHALELINNQ